MIDLLPPHDATQLRKPVPMLQPNPVETADVASLPDNIAKDLVQLFKLLSDETRLRILYYLMQQEELNVRPLCKLLRQSRPAVSQPLPLLRVAGLTESRRDG